MGLRTATPGEGSAENCLCHSEKETTPGDAKQITANLQPLKESMSGDQSSAPHNLAPCPENAAGVNPGCCAQKSTSAVFLQTMHAAW